MNASSSLSFYEAAVAAMSSVSIDIDVVKASSTVEKDNQTTISLARTFLVQACPSFLSALHDESSELFDQESISDRLIKLGRIIRSTVNDCSESKDMAEKSLALAVEECELLAHILNPQDQAHGPNSTVLSPDKLHKRVVPKVRFGKTELQMPILTLGCMRFQQSWNRGPADNVHTIDQVTPECQDNLIRILKYAIRVGINHIETAKAYGSSELQLGYALSALFKEGFVKREDLIIQSKAGVSAATTPQDLVSLVEDSLKKLQVEYLDLFSLHGLNTSDHYDWIFKRGKQGSLIEAVQSLKLRGKIRHIGFSTHAPVNIIRKLIESDVFEYVNLHYHWCGSYTCSGEGQYGGNIENVKLCAQKDMGVFIISAFDKGGRLYAPSKKLRSLTLPDLEPISYGALWLWHHERHDRDRTPIHTIVCGAARPSDLDQPTVAALMNDWPKTIQRVDNVRQRLRRAMDESFHPQWAEVWHSGLTNYQESKYGTQLGNVVWLYNLIKSYGMLEFSQERYDPLDASLQKYDTSKGKVANIASMGPFWGWAPGFAPNPEWDYSDDLVHCPEENLKYVKAAITFVHQLCSKESKKKEIHTQTLVEWETAYDLRPWVAFPERAPSPW
jgi:predicted aldo/keto reductase-like oxidoreductase